MIVNSDLTMGRHVIERYEVESFLTLAEELHFGRTAERLRVSAAHVSQTIRKLERRVGAALFHRSSRRVELTPLGRALAEELGPARAAVGAALQAAVEAGRGLSGSLRVAYVGAAAGQFVIGATEAFRGRAPDCEVHIREARMTEAVRWLRDGDVDLCLGPLPVHEPDLACGPALVSESRILAVPAGHRFDRPGGASPADLAGGPVLHVADHPALPAPPADRAAAAAAAAAAPAGRPAAGACPGSGHRPGGTLAFAEAAAELVDGHR
ncbi:LysR family transcriptional regulator [Kitasatospora sp. NBC_01560]|uniref:LysR family transcriptional regulator n=1 Tax=Kitasatospora sp. NBC_01560 TaxID=2975965 RepID=UPI00386809B5